MITQMYSKNTSRCVVPVDIKLLQIDKLDFRSLPRIYLFEQY